jgi:peptide/nickel transport system substrate-binding protein
MSRIFALSWVVVAAAGVCASGCARPETASPAQATMRIGLGVPKKAGAGTGMGYVVDAMTTEPWVILSADGRPSERLARSWNWDADGRILRLEIRKDVKFHDGTPLTARIAADAMREMLAAPENANTASFKAVRSVEVGGDDTVILHLSEPNSFLLSDLSFVSVTLKKNQHQIGTGPFVVAGRDEQHAELRAFAQYYRGRPALDAIDLNSYPTQRNAWAALMRGDVDMLYDVSREAMDFVKAETTVKTYSFLRPYYNVLVFNVRHPALKHAEVRRALNEAVDKQTLVQDALRGRGRPADGPLVPEYWAYSPPAHPFMFNPEAATARLEGAGFKVRPVPGGRMPSRFAFNCLIFADDPRFERTAVLVQKQLANVGVDMTLVPLPQNELVARLRRGDFDAFLFEMAGRALNWAYLFWHSSDNGLFDSGYRSTDAALDRIRLARSEEEIRSGVADFFQILHDDPPAVFLTWGETTRAVSRNFDVAAESGRDIVPAAGNWRVARK